MKTRPAKTFVEWVWQGYLNRSHLKGANSAMDAVASALQDAMTSASRA